MKRVKKWRDVTVGSVLRKTFLNKPIELYLVAQVDVGVHKLIGLHSGNRWDDGMETTLSGLKRQAKAVGFKL